jgi:MFS family permease
LTVAPDALKNTYLAVLGLSGLLMAGVVQAVIGWLSDRTYTPLGRRVPYLLWGSAFASIGLLGVGFAPNYLVLFGVWMFTQANVNVGYGPFNALIRDLVPVNRTGVASSIKILADAAGGAVLITLAGELMGRSSPGGIVDLKWVALGSLGFVLILTSLITSSIVRSREVGGESPSQVSMSPAGPNSGLHPQLPLFLLSRLLMFSAIASFPTYALFFLDDLGVDNPAQTLGRMIPVIGGAVILSVYPAGRLSDQIGRKPVIMVGAMGAAGSTIWMLAASSAIEAMAIAGVIGFSVGVLVSPNWALANDLGPRGREGLHMGMVNLSTIGGFAVAKVVGPGIDLVNRFWPSSGYDPLLIFCSALFFIGALLLMPLKTPVEGSLVSPETT